MGGGVPAGTGLQSCCALLRWAAMPPRLPSQTHPPLLPPLPASNQFLSYVPCPIPSLLQRLFNCQLTPSAVGLGSTCHPAPAKGLEHGGWVLPFVSSLYLWYLCFSSCVLIPILGLMQCVPASSSALPLFLFSGGWGAHRQNRQVSLGWVATP